MKNNESNEEASNNSDQPTTGGQQYEGDDVSALVAAKARMAQRDAEYAEKFRSLTDKPEPKPRQRAKAKPVAKESAAIEAPAKQASKPADEPAAEPVQNTEPPAREAVAAKNDAPATKNPASLSNSDVNGGLRSLRGESVIPDSAKSDREAFSRAWRTMK